MKSTRTVRLITDVITKRTTTTTTATAKAAAAQQLNYYEPQCPHASVQNDHQIISNTSSSLKTPTASSSSSSSLSSINTETPFTYETVRPYSEVPGPKPLPILGNTWR